MAAAMGREPVNIVLLKRRNDQYAAADRHATGVLNATSHARWFENDCRRLGQSDLRHVTPDIAPSRASLFQRPPLSPRDQIAQELSAANEVVKLERKARLRELFSRERLEFECELNAMGLAFDKHRD